MAQRRLKAEQFRAKTSTRFRNPLHAGWIERGPGPGLQGRGHVREVEERAHDTETRAHAMCRAASEKVRQAEMRAEAAERAHRELAIAADQRLSEASSALEQAQSRIRSQADKLTAAEFRAQSAEAEADRHSALSRWSKRPSEKARSPNTASRGGGLRETRPRGANPAVRCAAPWAPAA